MKTISLILILIPFIIFGQTLKVSNPLPMKWYYDNIKGNAEIGYFVIEHSKKDYYFYLLDPINFNEIKNNPIKLIENDEKYNGYRIINNRIYVFIIDDNKLYSKELDPKSGKIIDKKLLINKVPSDYADININTDNKYLSILFNNREYNNNSFYDNNNVKGGIYIFDSNLDNIFSSSFNFKLSFNFNLKNIDAVYDKSKNKASIILNINTSKPNGQTAIIIPHNYLMTLENNSNMKIEKENCLAFTILDFEAKGTKLFQVKTDENGNIIAQIKESDNSEIEDEIELPYLKHHTFNSKNYSMRNGLFITADIIGNKTLGNGNVLSLARINYKNTNIIGGYTSFKNYYFIEITSTGKIVNARGIPILDKFNDKKPICYTYDNGEINIVYIDNYENVIVPKGEKLEGNYLCAATLQNSGKLSVKVLSLANKYEKSKLYRLLENCSINKNNEFVTFAFKKKKEDLRFTIKFNN